MAKVTNSCEAAWFYLLPETLADASVSGREKVAERLERLCLARVFDAFDEADAGVWSTAGIGERRFDWRKRSVLNTLDPRRGDSDGLTGCVTTGNDSLRTLRLRSEREIISSL